MKLVITKFGLNWPISWGVSFDLYCKSWEFYRSRLSAETSKAFTVSVFLLGARIHVLLPGTWWLLFLQSIHVPSQYKFPQRFWLAILWPSPFLSKSPNSKTSAFVHLEHFFLYSSIAFHLQDGQRAWCSVLRDVGHLLSILTKNVFTWGQKFAIRMIVQLTVILMMVFWPVYICKLASWGRVIWIVQYK